MSLWKRLSVAVVESLVGNKRNGNKPELCSAILPPYVDVLGFVSFVAQKKNRKSSTCNTAGIDATNRATDKAVIAWP
jgi:hypothetical protein